jgi:hypothetical protein
VDSADYTESSANENITDTLKNFEAMGWYWNGELHAMKGFHLVEYEDGCIGIEKDQ